MAMKLDPATRAKVLGQSPAPKKKPKYRNEKVSVGRLAFDSKKEARRWEQLTRLYAAGAIADLKRQTRLRCVVNGEKVCTYVADFTYLEAGRFVVEDVKSPFTRKLAVYRLKKRLVKACLGLEIREI